MKVSLITLQDDLNTYGLRCLSSTLRARGMDTQLIFLDRWGPYQAMREYQGRTREVSPAMMDQVAEACSDSDLIGFSVLTMYHEGSAQLTRHLKKQLGRPVVWGGIHTLCDPEECLNHADAICLGEAEDTFPEVVDRLVHGGSLKGVAGAWAREGSEIVQNPARQPVSDLDRFPHPDISAEGHLVFQDGRLKPLTPRELLKRWHGHYMTINARGCSMRCTYCCNSQLSRRFDWTYVRHKSVERIIHELKRAVTAYPALQGVKFSDDAFGDLPLSYIKEFSAAYKKEIGLPLGIPGFSPTNLTKDKLEPLVDAGLEYLRLGLQSGSPAVRKLYGRHDTNEEIIKAVSLVEQYGDKIKRFKLDVITDNPWETEADTLETIKLLARLPKPYVLAVFSLTLFPGTPLYLKARQEGLLGEGEFIPYRKHFYNLDLNNRLNKIIYLFKQRVVNPERIEKLVKAHDTPEAFDKEYRRYLWWLALDWRNWPVWRLFRPAQPGMW